MFECPHFFGLQSYIVISCCCFFSLQGLGLSQVWLRFHWGGVRRLQVQLCFGWETSFLASKKNCFTPIFFILLSSLLQDSSTSSSSEESDSLFSEVRPYSKQCWIEELSSVSVALFDTFASLVSLWAMAAAVYGALCSAVASAVLGVRPRRRRAGICGSEPSVSGVARRRRGPRTRVSVAAWRGEVPQVWAKTCSGRVCGNGTQKLWQCLNHFVCQLSYICSFFLCLVMVNTRCTCSTSKMHM